MGLLPQKGGATPGTPCCLWLASSVPGCRAPCAASLTAPLPTLLELSALGGKCRRCGSWDGIHPAHLIGPAPNQPGPLRAVALAAAKDAFSQKMQERGNTNAKFWSQGVLSALGGERHWHQVGLRQLRWVRPGCPTGARGCPGGCKAGALGS